MEKSNAFQNIKVIGRTSEHIGSIEIKEYTTVPLKNGTACITFHRLSITIEDQTLEIRNLVVNVKQKTEKGIQSFVATRLQTMIFNKVAADRGSRPLYLYMPGSDDQSIDAVILHKLFLMKYHYTGRHDTMTDAIMSSLLRLVFSKYSIGALVPDTVYSLIYSMVEICQDFKKLYVGKDGVFIESHIGNNMGTYKKLVLIKRVNGCYRTPAHVGMNFIKEYNLVKNLTQ